ncbi:MAG TPA: citramalate synthase [Candidatus Limnocylindrales bacterium]
MSAPDGADRPVLLYDTTLRDGTQREGLIVSLADKLKIARRLDGFGFPYVEGGWPGSNPKDAEFFAAARSMTWQTARLAAFGSTRHRLNRPDADPNLRALVDAGTPVITIFGKSWLLHVIDVLGATPDENLAMVGDSVAFTRAAGREVVYDAEHFFDGYKDDAAYALATLRAARAGGATSLVLCDTNGGTLTDDVVGIIRAVRAALDEDDAPGVTWGIHVHNDAELAVANSLAAVANGIRHVQGTINGYGERCGNANLVSILADLALKTRHEVVPSGRLAELTELSRYVAEIVNITPDDHQPYVGRSAFAHKGGVHGAAVAKVERSYQHIDPGVVGNVGRLVVSELGGRANTQLRAEQLGQRLEGVDPRQLSQLIKRLEADGLAFEGAEASFELLVRRHRPGYVAPFRILDFTVLVEQRAGAELRAEATVKVEVEGEVLHTAADGNGPVNALDAALRKALRAFYPGLDSVHLVDYKVRILDGDAATAARTRVIIDSSDGSREWSTMGSDTNIIAASCAALSDSIEYAIWKTAYELRRRDERHFTTATATATAGATAAATAASPPSGEGEPAATRAGERRRGT